MLNAAYWTALVLFAQAPAPETPPDAAAIMAKVAANVEKATGARKQYVYHQLVRSSLVRSNGQVARRERREYSAFPGETRTEKKLLSFQGEYRKGKQMIPFSDPGFHYKSMDIDADLLKSLSEELVNDKESRDGIPHDMFPLRTEKLPSYNFTLKGTTEVNGRTAYRIGFEPRKVEGSVTIGKEDKDKKGKDSDDQDDEDIETEGTIWMGEALVDAAEFQPVRIDTHLALHIPWGVRVFLGTNLRQTGFSVNYVRVAENVWFPSTYGTEFSFSALWAYKRTMTLSLENNQFQKTGADSKIDYDLPQQ